MTAFPSITVFTGASTTEGDAKTYMTALQAALTGLLGSSGNPVSARAVLGTPMHSSLDLSAAYTVIGTDCGRVLKCTGTWTLAFTAAITLGDGFYVEVVNVGAGTITLDPNASELIGGATTKTLLAGSSVIVFCDGTRFLLIGGGVTAADIAAALGYTPANLANAATDHNHSGTYAPTTAFVAASTHYTGTAKHRFTRANGSYIDIESDLTAP